MSERPYIICHMIASLDGKILTRRWKELPAFKSVSGLYESTASEYEIGSWLVGTNTMKEFCAHSTPLPTAGKAVPTGDFVAKENSETHAIGVDAHGVLRFDSNEIGGDHIVIIITEKVGDDYRAHLREQGVSYLICGKERVDLKKAVHKLRSTLGLKKLLLEGGGVLNGAMLEQGLVDEISHIIAPVIDGGGPQVTGIYDTATKKPGKKAVGGLKLIAHETLEGGAQWLRYKVRYDK